MPFKIRRVLNVTKFLDWSSVYGGDRPYNAFQKKGHLALHLRGALENPNEAI
jgi:hypothetical protein